MHYRTLRAQSFFVLSKQIKASTRSDGQYEISFQMEGIRLVSATITNRPYEIVDGEVQYKTMVQPGRVINANLLQKEFGGGV